jgi:hypothetical protein
MKRLVLTLAVFTLLAPIMTAQEQDKFRLKGKEAAMVIGRAITIPENQTLPMVKGAAFIVEAGPNTNTDRKVTLGIQSPVGQYTVRGFIGGVETPIPLGAWDYGLGSNNSVTAITIINGDPSQVLPNLGQFWKVDVIHFVGGTIEQLSASVGPYEDTLSGFNFTMGPRRRRRRGFIRLSSAALTLQRLPSP